MPLMPSCVTIADLELAIESRELLELSQLTDPLAQNINTAKIQYALDRATELINSYYVTANDCGKAMIKLSCKQLTIDFTVWMLDTTKARPFIVDNYKDAIKRLEDIVCGCKTRCPISSADIAEILGGPKTSGGLRCGNSFDGCGCKSKNIDTLRPIRRIDRF